MTYTSELEAYTELIMLMAANGVSLTRALYIYVSLS